MSARPGDKPEETPPRTLEGLTWSPFAGPSRRYRTIGTTAVAALIAAIALALPASIALAERGQGGTSALPDWAPYVMSALALALIGWGLRDVYRRHVAQVRTYFLLCSMLPLLMLVAGWWEFLTG